VAAFTLFIQGGIEMTRASVCVAVLGVVLGIVGCGSDDAGGGGSKGGSCITQTPSQCYQVTKPADYNLNAECTAFGGTWSQDPCNPTNYERKCTDTLTDDETGEEQTYVYFFPAGSTEGCLGTEEPL
jgi:hypothetical protein